MASLRRHEGYLLIDHRASPGTPDVPEGTVFECATITCRHCQQRIMRNPMRTREREWCSGCDHYICDRCGLVKKITGECQDIKRLFDKLQNEALLIDREPALTQTKRT
jgi:hypothetical protein